MSFIKPCPTADRGGYQAILVHEQSSTQGRLERKLKEEEARPRERSQIQNPLQNKQEESGLRTWELLLALLFQLDAQQRHISFLKLSSETEAWGARDRDIGYYSNLISRASATPPGSLHLAANWELPVSSPQPLMRNIQL